MAENLRANDPAKPLSEFSASLIRECKVEQESALYTSTTYYIWLRVLKCLRAAAWIVATMCSITAASQMLKGDPDHKLLVALLTLAGLMIPAVIRALKLDSTIITYTKAVAKYKVLQAELRRCAEIWWMKGDDVLEKEARRTFRSLDKVKALSLTPPEWCFKRAQAKVKRGDYTTDVPE